MAKFWVNVRGKHEFPHDGRSVAVYGSLRDAEIYAYDHECYSHRINHVTIMQEMPDYSLEIIKEYEV